MGYVLSEAYFISIIFVYVMYGTKLPYVNTYSNEYILHICY